jgi:phosphoenolpyruvate carboxylase
MKLQAVAVALALTGLVTSVALAQGPPRDAAASAASGPSWRIAVCHRTHAAGEPFRQKVGFMLARLRAARRLNAARLEEAPAPPADPGDARIAYGGPHELLADLEALDAGLRRVRGDPLADGSLRDLVRRVRVFGFHLARLDLRQHSAVHARALAELLAAAGVERDYLGLDESARAAALARELANPRPLTPAGGAYSAETGEVLAVFHAARRLQREFGVEACNVYIISMTAGASDVLAALLLAKEAGLFEPGRDGAPPRSTLQIVPLF